MCPHVHMCPKPAPIQAASDLGRVPCAWQEALVAHPFSMQQQVHVSPEPPHHHFSLGNRRLAPLSIS